MQKLYAVAYQRILNRLGQEALSPSRLPLILSDNNIREAGDFIYHRMPREELRQFIKNPCPVTSLQGEDSQIIIESSKRIRGSFSVDEKKVCNRCPFKDSCRLSGQKSTGETLNAMKDLLTYMEAMRNLSLVENSIEFRVWKSAYKACDSILAVIEDLSQGGVETFEFEKIRLTYVEQKREEEIAAKDFTAELTHFNMEAKKNPKPKKQNPRIKQVDIDEEEEQFEDFDFPDEEQSAPKKKSKKSVEYGDLYEEESKFLKENTRPRKSNDAYERKDRRSEISDRDDWRSKSNSSGRDGNRRNDSRRDSGRRDQGQRYEGRQGGRNDYEKEWQKKQPRRRDFDRQDSKPWENDRYQRGQPREDNYKNSYNKPDNRQNYRDKPSRDRQFREERGSPDNKRSYSEDRSYNNKGGNKSYSNRREPEDISNDYIERKFEKAGEAFKNPKVYQNWDNFAQEPVRRPQRNDEGFTPKKEAARAEQEQPVRRGRNIRR